MNIYLDKFDKNMMERGIFSSSGDFFRRIDINTNFLKRENGPKVYMISFGKEENNNLFINRICL